MPDEDQPADPCRLCGSVQTQLHGACDDGDYDICSDCGMVQLRAAFLPSRRTERSHYDMHENNPDDPRYRAFLDRLVTPLIKHLPRGASGLDYGCGPGPTISVVLREQGFDCADYDPFFRPDPAPLERTYDFITASEVAEHLHQPAVTFARLDRLLRPGGWLGIMTTLLPADGDFCNWYYRRDPTHVCFYGPDTFEWIASHFDWKLERPRKNVALFRKGR